MRVPLDVFGLICEYLPDEVVFNLWNTGRELHNKIKFRRIYIGKILPFLRMVTMSKLDIYFKNLYLKNCNFFYVEIDDGWILKSFGVMKCKWSLHYLNIKNKIFTNMTFNCGQMMLDSLSEYLQDEESSITLYMFWSNDNLHRTDTFVLEKVEYLSYLCVFPLLKLTIKKRYEHYLVHFSNSSKTSKLDHFEKKK